MTSDTLHATDQRGRAEQVHLLAECGTPGPHRRGSRTFASSHRPRRAVLASAALALAALAFTAAPVFAARTYESQITEANGAPFSNPNPRGLTTDSSDNLWVANTGAGGLVDKFDSSGNFLAQSTGTPWTGAFTESLAFSNAADEVFVSDSNADDLWGLEPSAAYSSIDLKPLGNTVCCYLRVGADNSGTATDGDLYVFSSSATVTRIDTSGNPVNYTAGSSAGTNQLSGADTPSGFFAFFGPSPTAGLAVDSSGDLFVADSGHDVVDEFASSGEYLRSFEETGPGEPFGSVSAVAIDPTTANVLIADPANHVVDEFSPSGEFLEAIAEANGSPLGNPQALAVDSSGQLYVADGASQLIDVFGSSGPPLPKLALEVQKTGAGSGTVTSSPGGINCGATCEHEFSEGKTVTLKARPGFTSAFTGWTGCDSEPSATECEVEMTTAKLVKAEFTAIPQEALEVEKTGSGAGTVTGTAPTGFTPIECGSTCEAEYNQGATLTLTAQPAGLTTAFTGWTGCDSEPSATECEVEMTTAKLVKAEFTAIPQEALEVEKTGSGAGTVTGTAPTGFTPIECGSTCEAEYNQGATLTLTAEPDERSGFTGWTGCDEVPSPTECKVEMSAGKKVTAQFTSLLSLSAPSGLEPTSVVLNGHIDPLAGDGNIASCDFEYVVDVRFQEVGFATASTAPCSPAAPSGGYSSETEVSAPLGNLRAGFTYHYRLSVSNSTGTHRTLPQEFATPQAPTIESFSSSEVTATSAVLHAKLNPQGFDTTYRFEYGPTSAYGETAEGEITGELSTSHPVEVHLTGLQSVTYHFRVVAESKWGTTASEDGTFEFYPPNCPNAHIRQQTGADFLPDCRAYELVSPANAGGTILSAGGPNTGLATNPSRLSFVGNFGTVPGSGDPINARGDLYVSTRTNEGWVTKYVGPPANETSCAGGPPYDSYFQPEAPTINGVMTDPAMGRFLDWSDGIGDNCGSGASIFHDPNTNDVGSLSPYLWDSGGNLLQRLPANLADVEGGSEALDCQNNPQAEYSSANLCSGVVAASGDLSHFLFSTQAAPFGGRTAPPGSAYDNDVAANTVTLISKKANGVDIPQDPANTDNTEVIAFPAVSTDGSHILMSTRTSPCSKPRYSGGELYTNRCPDPNIENIPRHLYMRVNDDVTYEIPPSGAVVDDFAGMTEDGSNAYFTSAEQLTSEDHDNSVDLYMWSAEKAEREEPPLTLISKGSEGTGNSDACSASWIARCDAMPYSNIATYHQGDIGTFTNAWPGASGNSAIASQSGDIYFYSPEQLDEPHGIQGGQNLYVYRNGHVQYVTTFTPSGPYCAVLVPGDPHNAGGQSNCADGPIARVQVSPNGEHMAFLTADRVTSYDNTNPHGSCATVNGDPTGETHCIEMYSYDPESGKLTCDSCLPSGEPPTSSVNASQDGRFMTNDGRTFFDTVDPLVPQDTNRADDVYEFVNGRPQLITAGTGAGTGAHGVELRPGLDGVSADGTDVYFATLDTLVGQDENGNLMKFYDARTNGGFPFIQPPPPCAAADECHGAGSSAPALPATQTGADLGAGANASPRAKPKHRHRKHRKKATAKRHHKRAAKHSHRGAR